MKHLERGDARLQYCRAGAGSPSSVPGAVNDLIAAHFSEVERRADRAIPAAADT